nr:hypothetical protein [Tanacetum cinerariifolium]
ARIAQSSTLPPVADEPASPLRDVSQGEACPTISSLDAEQYRDLTNLCTSPQRQQLDLVSKFEAQELEITMLKARVKLLKDREGGVAERSRDDAPIKGRSLDEGEKVAKKVSNDTEEMINVLTSMDAATVLSSGVAEVPTGSGSIPTAGLSATGVPTGSDVVPTVGLVFATATVMDIQMARQLEEEMEREAQRMNEQIARDAEIARIHAEEELQIMIDGLDRSNETIEDFIPMGPKEETKRFKRKGLKLEQVSEKKLKTSEEVPEEVKATEEVPGDKVKEMMQLVPVEEHLDREDLNQLWRLVKETLSIKPPTSDKEMELWVELKRLYEPDDEDQLWTHTQNIMHAPVEWKLYDSCGVHHVTFKDKEIFMLVEKDYPLRKGLAIVMISCKLQGRIVGNKMHKAFPLPVMEFPLPEEVPTASEESSHC